MSSIEHRTNSTGTQSWRVRFRHDGSNKAVTFDSPERAESFRAVVDSLGPTRALALASTPTVTPTPGTRRTVAAQVAHHIEHLTGIEDGTRRKYRRIHAARLAEPFAHVMLADLTRDHVSAWVNSQTGAPKTIRNAHSLLSAALTSAVRDELVPANVAKGVRLPKRDADAGEHVYLTEAEVGHLVALLKPHWRPLTVFLVGTGVRFGEATAVQVRDLDLDALDSTGRPSPRARISRAWKETSGGPALLGAPKTSRSRRTVSIPPGMADPLRDYVQGKRADEFVFTNTHGNPVRNGGFHETAWQPVMDEFEALTGKRPRVHDLRHTYASWAIARRNPLTVIQRQMGHESITTTSDTYGHLERSDLDALAASIGANLPQIEG